MGKFIPMQKIHQDWLRGIISISYRPFVRRSSNDSSIARRPEYKKFKEANGYHPPARRSSSAFVDIDLNNSSSNDNVDQSRRSFVDQHGDASSVMSSLTSSSLSSSGNLPEKPSNHRLV